MREYIMTLIYISVFSIVLEVILPETKLKRYISSMIALTVIIVAMSSVIRFIKQEDVVSVLSNAYQNINLDFAGNWQQVEGSSEEQIKSSVKRKVELDILNRYNDNEVFVNKVEVDLTDEYKIKEVNIYVSDIKTVNEAKDIMRSVTEDYDLKDGYINVIKGE